MLDQIKTDIDAVMHRDPAAKTRLEAHFVIPVCMLSGSSRLAHKLYLKGWVLIPRLLNTFSRFLTGIDIHPEQLLDPDFLSTMVWVLLLAKQQSLVLMSRSIRE